MINSFPFSEAAENILQFQGGGKQALSDVMALGPKYCVSFLDKITCHDQFIDQEFQNHYTQMLLYNKYLLKYFCKVKPPPTCG